MLISILHRATGSAMAVAGGIGLAWWLAALAGGPDSYRTFCDYVIAAQPGEAGETATNWIARIVAIGLTWAFFQHLLSGVRHLVLDTGAGYELGVNKRWSQVIVVAAPILTLLVWAAVFAGAL